MSAIGFPQAGGAASIRAIGKTSPRDTEAPLTGLGHWSEGLDPDAAPAGRVLNADSDTPPGRPLVAASTYGELRERGIL